MGEKINKEFEEFQKNLKEREKNLRIKVKFEKDDKIEEELEELKEKEVIL
jgi:hypothetical protein